MNVWDFVKSINEKKYLYEDVDKNNYSSYIVNRSFSFFPDTILLANEMNRFPSTEPKQHYDFLYHATTKKKRWSKWIKPINDEDAKMLSEKLSIRYERAVELMSILTESELKTLKDNLNTDGLDKCKGNGKF